jgi:hypothetical protein
MSHDDPAAAGSRREGFAKRFALSLGTAVLLGSALLLMVGAAELLVRRQGLQPWQVEHAGPRIDPGGKVVQHHPTLGYTHLPGRYRVTLRDGFWFEMTHGSDTLRVTGPAADAEGREIWILGCSLTHGWTLNDAETYPWVLQQMLPQYRIVNFGVSGYGTVQSLLQFSEALRSLRPRPVLAILAYGDFHDARNTLARQRRKEIAPWNRMGPLHQPYARLRSDGTLAIAKTEVTYREFPLMRTLALVHKLESRYNEFEVVQLRSHEVSEQLVLEIAALAREHGVGFVLAGIWNGSLTADMLAFAAEHGIDTVDIAVDTSLPEYNNLPHDVHPSALANRHYAEALAAHLARPGASMQAFGPGVPEIARDPRR